MKHIKSISVTPRHANIDLGGIFDSKVETKENVINEKATILS